MQSFAEKHGHEFYGASYTFVPGGRPPAWLKLLAITESLVDCDEVLWLDTDIAVVDDAEDLAAPEDSLQALVEHVTSEGHVPNTGVWLVRREMLPFLMCVAMQDRYVHHRWWEQAAVISQMGYDATDGVCKHSTRTQLFDSTFFLPESWNVWRGSDPSIQPKIRHACGLHGDGEQLQAVTEWLA